MTTLLFNHLAVDFCTYFTEIGTEFRWNIFTNIRTITSSFKKHKLFCGQRKKVNITSLPTNCAAGDHLWAALARRGVNPSLYTPLTSIKRLICPPMVEDK